MMQVDSGNLQFCLCNQKDEIRVRVDDVKWKLHVRAIRSMLSAILGLWLEASTSYRYLTARLQSHQSLNVEKVTISP